MSVATLLHDAACFVSDLTPGDTRIPPGILGAVCAAFDAKAHGDTYYEAVAVLANMGFEPFNSFRFGPPHSEDFERQLHIFDALTLASLVCEDVEVPA